MEPTPLEAFLQNHDEEAWNKALDRLRDSIHPVDRDAVGIWFSFWPLKLTDSLRKSEDPLQIAQELLLYGEYELQKGLDRSVEFLYGSRFWQEMRNAVVQTCDGASQPESLSLENHIRNLGKEVADRQGVEVSLALGIAAVALMVLRQIGLQAFRGEGATGGKPARTLSPEAVIRRRERPRKKSFFDFLRTVDRRYRIVWDENRDKGRFEAIQGQDIAMAAANDESDYQGIDRRRVEGPVPIQCRNGACGFCWVGVLGGRRNLSEITDFERKRLKHFGYHHDEFEGDSHPAVRLACQSKVYGEITIVIPPWNGVLQGRR